jgi:UDP-glucose 4-epimerase
MQAVKTNVEGTQNVILAADFNGVKKVICLSTDKAAYPINAMGMSKAMMEKVFIAKSNQLKSSDTHICGTRYGNVLNSRGSVVPLFVEQIKAGKSITVTDPTMTRFIMSLPDAMDLVMFAFEHAKPGDLLIQKAPSCRIGDLALALCEIFSYDKKRINVIGTRHGEKRYEVLMTKEEASRSIDMEKYLRIPVDGRDLNYGKFLEEGSYRITTADEYNSDNTKILEIPEIISRLLDLKSFKSFL